MSIQNLADNYLGSITDFLFQSKMPNRSISEAHWTWQKKGWSWNVKYPLHFYVFLEDCWHSQSQWFGPKPNKCYGSGRVYFSDSENCCRMWRNQNGTWDKFHFPVKDLTNILTHFHALEYTDWIPQIILLCLPSLKQKPKIKCLPK